MLLFLLKFLLDCLELLARFVSHSNPALHVSDALLVLFDFFKELADEINFLVELLLELHRLLDHFLLFFLLGSAKLGQNLEVALKCLHRIHLIFEFFAKCNVLSFELLIR